MRSRLSVVTVLTVIVSLCVAGAASAATRYYEGDESFKSAADVRIKNKEPKQVNNISWGPISTRECGFNHFYSGSFRDLRVRNDRFKGEKKTHKVVGEFSNNARKINVTFTHKGKDPCKIKGVMKKSGCPYIMCKRSAAAEEVDGRPRW